MVSAALSACAINGLAFVRDERVDIVAPEERAEVTLPVTVDWTAKELDGRRFGVFVDRPPPPPGREPAWVFRDHAACKGRGASRCRTPEFLASQRVFTTDETRFHVTEVAKLASGGGVRTFHEVTVVLLDDDGRRAGEGAWSVQFALEDER